MVSSYLGDAAAPRPAAESIGQAKADEVSISGEAIEAYIERLKASRIDAAMLGDVIEAYALAHFESQGDRDAFLQDMSEPPHGPAVQKAILDIIFAVSAATEMPSEADFQAVVVALGVGSDEDAEIRDVQRDLIATMKSEAEVSIGIVSEAQFSARLDWATSQLRLS